MDADFSGTVWISVNMLYMYMYAVVRPSKYVGGLVPSTYGPSVV